MATFRERNAHTWGVTIGTLRICCLAVIQKLRDHTHSIRLRPRWSQGAVVHGENKVDTREKEGFYKAVAAARV
jgi:hypothetical protein